MIISIKYTFSSLHKFLPYLFKVVAGINFCNSVDTFIFKGFYLNLDFFVWWGVLIQNKFLIQKYPLVSFLLILIGFFL